MLCIVSFTIQFKIGLDSLILTLHNDSISVNLLNNTDTIVRITEAVLIPNKIECLISVIVPSHFGTGLAIVDVAVWSRFTGRMHVPCGHGPVTSLRPLRARRIVVVCGALSGQRAVEFKLSV